MIFEGSPHKAKALWGATADSKGSADMASLAKVFEVHV